MLRLTLLFCILFVAVFFVGCAEGSDSVSEVQPVDTLVEGKGPSTVEEVFDETSREFNKSVDEAVEKVDEVMDDIEESLKQKVDPDREIIKSSSKKGTTLEINKLTFEKKGDNWGKIMEIGISVENNMEEAYFPHFQIFVYGKEDADPSDRGTPKDDIIDGFLSDGEGMTNVYPIEASIAGADKTKIVKVDLLESEYPRKVLNSVEYEVNLFDLES